MSGRERSDSSAVEYTQSQTQTRVAAPGGEIVIGTLVALNALGRPLVNFNASGEQFVSLEATTTLSLTPREVGRQAALLFIDSDIQKPVVIGLVHSSLNMLLESYQTAEADLQKTGSENPSPGEAKEAVGSVHGLDDVVVDGKRVQIEGKEEIVFKCGESSITMTKAGKITIRGKYILNRSSGVNRILGGSVQVN